MIAPPTLWLIAGPNGVGKTTYAFRHIEAVSGSIHFINLDEISRGLSPLSPGAARLAAARVAIARTREMIAAKASFSMETTLAGMTHLDIIDQARRAGLQANLLFFMVRDVSTCLARVARRVGEGGHDVPRADVERRFGRALANFPRYAAAVDLWRVLDNNGPVPATAAEGRRGCRSMTLDGEGLPESLRAAIKEMPECGELLFQGLVGRR